MGESVRRCGVEREGVLWVRGRGVGEGHTVGQGACVGSGGVAWARGRFLCSSAAEIRSVVAVLQVTLSKRQLLNV